MSVGVYSFENTPRTDISVSISFSLSSPVDISMQIGFDLKPFDQYKPFDNSLHPNSLNAVFIEIE